MIGPPRWTDVQLAEDIQRAVAIFRRERMQEPLQAYLRAFDEYRGHVGNLLDASADLTKINDRAREVLTHPGLLEAFRYVAGQPLSADDLKTLSEAVLTPTRLRQDPSMARRVVEIVSMGLDRRRFPWVSENREPTHEERAAAILASAALMATRRVGTARRHEGKEAQELFVERTMSTAGLTKVDPRPIPTLHHAQTRASFVGKVCLARERPILSSASGTRESWQSSAKYRTPR